MAWDRDKDFLSPLGIAIMANLDRCFAGDRSAYEAILRGFHDTYMDSSQELSPTDRAWAEQVAQDYESGLIKFTQDP